jgi:hypothetical protein
VLYRADEVLYRADEILYRAVEILYRAVEVLYRADGAPGRSNHAACHPSRGLARRPGAPFSPMKRRAPLTIPLLKGARSTTFPGPP